MQPQIILASGSPRRRQFLHELGLDFEIIIADIDETPLANERPAKLVQRLAAAKARAAAARLSHDREQRLIIASDTVVAVDDTLLGKPGSAEEAIQMLSALRGRRHRVHSAVSLLSLPDRRQTTHLNTTCVTMRSYSEAEMRAYVATRDPLDKAGAYAIQNPDFAPVAKLDGCLSGVMGLPLADLRRLLAEFGCSLDVDLPSICERHAGFCCCQSAAGASDGFTDVGRD